MDFLKVGLKTDELNLINLSWILMKFYTVLGNREKRGIHDSSKLLLFNLSIYYTYDLSVFKSLNVKDYTKQAPVIITLPNQYAI